MNKKLIFFILLVISIIVSCSYLKKNETVDSINTTVPSSKNDLKKNDESIAKNTARYPEQPNLVPPTSIKKPPSSWPDKVVTQYDVQALDEQVRVEAKKVNQNPDKYRLLLRADGEGNKVYRAIGMHVIVSALGEETYLPDEI